MHEHIFVSEAHECRNLALRYDGGPEQRLLINVAAAFEELARSASGRPQPATNGQRGNGPAPR